MNGLTYHMYLNSLNDLKVVFNQLIYFKLSLLNFYLCIYLKKGILNLLRLIYKNII